VSPASGGTLTPAATLTEAAGTYIDYTIGRPAFGAGTGRVTYTATASGRVSDSDAVDVPAQERDTINLLSRARIFSQTATQMVIRYAVATPVALSPNTASITYVTEGLTGVSPTSPQSVTPETNTVITEPAGSYVDFTVPRPAATATPGRITFQSTATGRTASTDAVDHIQSRCHMERHNCVRAGRCHAIRGRLDVAAYGDYYALRVPRIYAGGCICRDARFLNGVGVDRHSASG
jgi:hypothetical protein